jgi:hypothetical protein
LGEVSPCAYSLLGIEKFKEKFKSLKKLGKVKRYNIEKSRKK